MNKLICLSLFTLMAVSARAQDNIILKSGQEVPAKVLEVSKAEIKYKRTDNPDGPMYTMPAGEVFLIKYANGTKDILSNQPETQPGNGPINRMRGGRGMGGRRFDGGGAGTSGGGAAPTLVGLRYHSSLFSHYFVDGQGSRLAYSDVRSMMAGQPEAVRALQRGRQLRVAALVTAIPAVALIGTGIALAADGRHWGRNGGFGRNNDPTDFDPNGNGMMSDRNGNRAEIGAALAGGGLLLGVVSGVLSHKATVNFRRAASRYRAGGDGVSLQISPAQQGVGVGMALRF